MVSLELDNPGTSRMHLRLAAFLFASTSVLAAPLVPTEQTGTIAVLELKNKLTADIRLLIDAAFLTDQVRAGLLDSAPKLRMITRENILLLLQSFGRTLEECESECEVETGRRIGADYVVTGEVLRYGRGYRLNLRLHSTGEGRLLSVAVASGETADALETDLQRAIKKLAEVFGHTPTLLASSSGRDWRKVKSTGWIDLVAKGGFAVNAANTVPNEGTRSLELGWYGVASLGTAAGWTLLLPPNRELEESSWFGFRLGAGGDMVRTFTSAGAWNALRFGPQLGPAWYFGDFQKDPAEWSGLAFGIDLRPQLTVYLGEHAPSATGVGYGGELDLYLADAKFSLRGQKRLHWKVVMAASVNRDSVSYIPSGVCFGVGMTFE